MIKREDVPALVWQAIRVHALNDYPKESCGVILRRDSDRQLEYVPITNKSSNPGEHFVCCPEEWSLAEDRGQVVATIHSHPDGSSALSPGDRRVMEQQQLPWAVVSVLSDPVAPRAVADISWSEPTGYEFPLIGRPFSHGIMDCYTIVQDYYSRELGIELPNFPREDKWWERGDSLYLDRYAEAGFFPIPLSEVQKHDCFLMRIRAKVPNHSAIYIGDGKIIHHMYERLSTCDIYGGYWQANTTHVLRHKDVHPIPEND